MRGLRRPSEVWFTAGRLRRSVLYAYGNLSLHDEEQRLNWALLYHRHRLLKNKRNNRKQIILKKRPSLSHLLILVSKQEAEQTST